MGATKTLLAADVYGIHQNIGGRRSRPHVHRNTVNSSCARAQSLASVVEAHSVRGRHYEAVDVTCCWVGRCSGQKADNTRCWMEVQLREWVQKRVNKHRLAAIGLTYGHSQSG